MRNQRLDLIKGFAIIAMVIGHSGAPFAQFLYLFHMAIFIMASGFCFKSENSHDLKKVYGFVIRRIKGLYVPYLFWTIVFLLCHNLFIKINIYTNNPMITKYVSEEYVVLKEYISIPKIINSFIYALVMHCNTQLGGAFWFFYTLLIISVGYCIIDYVLRKFLRIDNTDLIQLIIGIVFLQIGYYFKLKQITMHGLNLFFSYYSLFYLGYLFRRLDKEDYLKKYLYAIMISSFVLLLVFYQSGVRIGLGANNYVNPIILIAASFSGWYLLKTISMIIERYNCKTLSSFISYVGKNSLCIMILHFLSFKVVNLFIVLIWDLPACAIAAFPILTDEGIWWVFYAISGILVPLLTKKLLDKLVIRLGDSKIPSLHLL